uniref:Sphingomyelin synthase-related protein 1 n=1 Tax=Gouania willdenowi TaxID=441366 RepID=A0A8C5DMM3_GOUWI
MAALSVRRWTPKHVAKWLREEGFCDYVGLLCNRHRLDGTSLLALTEYDLRSPPLELKVLGDIKRLMVSIRKLQKNNVAVLPFDAHSPSGSGGSLDWLLGEDYHQYTNGKYKQQMRRLDPECWKTVLSSIYVVFVFGFTSFVMVIVHERVPDMRTYPPLPDFFLDSASKPRLFPKQTTLQNSLTRAVPYRRKSQQWHILCSHLLINCVFCFYSFCVFVLYLLLSFVYLLLGDASSPCLIHAHYNLFFVTNLKARDVVLVCVAF